MKISLVILMVAVVVGCPVPGVVRDASAQEYSSADLTWTAPTSGALAVRYLVRIRDLDGTLNETYTVDAVSGINQRFTFTRLEYARRYQGRVAAIDAQGRQGPWSEWSPVYDRESSVPQP
jgi:hypothetical protein